MADSVLRSKGPMAYFKLNEPNGASGVLNYDSAGNPTGPTGSFIGSITYGNHGSIYNEPSGGGMAFIPNASAISLGKIPKLFETIATSGLHICGIFRPRAATWSNLFGIFNAVGVNGIKLDVNDLSQVWFWRQSIFDRTGAESRRTYTFNHGANTSGYIHLRTFWYAPSGQLAQLSLRIDEVPWQDITTITNAASGGLVAATGTTEFILGGRAEGATRNFNYSADVQRWAFFAGTGYTDNDFLDILKEQTYTVKGIAGVVAYYNASSGVYSNLAGTVPATSGDRIARWNDLGPSGFHMLNTSTISQPVYDTRYLKPVVGFDNNHQNISALYRKSLFCSGFSQLFPGWSACASVLRPFAASEFGVSYQPFIAGFDAKLAFCIRSNGPGIVRNTDFRGAFTSGVPAIGNAPGITVVGAGLGIGGAAGSGGVFCDGVFSASSGLLTGGNIAIPTVDMMSIGGYPTGFGGSFYNGFADEIIICNRPITSGEYNDYYNQTITEYNLHSRRDGIVVVGDSIASSSNVSGLNIFFTLFPPREAERFLWRNASYPGAELDDVAQPSNYRTLAEAGRLPSFFAKPSGVTRLIALIESSTNDLNRGGTLPYFDYLQLYGTGLVPRGITTVLTITQPPNTSAGGSPSGVAYKASLVANPDKYTTLIQLPNLANDGTHWDTSASGHYLAADYIWNNGLAAALGLSSSVVLLPSNISILDALHRLRKLGYGNQ